MRLSNEDANKVPRPNKANSLAYQPALEKIAGFDINWNIVAYPGASWAKQVFPGDAEEVAVAKLAAAIFAASRVDGDDSIGAWDANSAALRKRTEWRKGKTYRAQHYSGPGKDQIGRASCRERVG